MVNGDKTGGRKEELIGSLTEKMKALYERAGFIRQVLERGGHLDLFKKSDSLFKLSDSENRLKVLNDGSECPRRTYTRTFTGMGDRDFLDGIWFRTLTRKEFLYYMRKYEAYYAKSLAENNLSSVMKKEDKETLRFIRDAIKEDSNTPYIQPGDE